MSKQWLVIQQLDKQFQLWKELGQLYPRPTYGWIKVIRTALSMTSAQLAKRLGLSDARIAQLEYAEANDSLTLRSLRQAAAAMDCELIYAIVPKGKLTLDTIVTKQISEIANEQVSRAAHSMSLEAQSIDEKTINDQKIEVAQNLKRHLNKKIWR